MMYTAEAPTEPGYYWLKSEDGEEIVEAWIDPAETERRLFIHRCGDGEGCEMASVRNAHWAGPIPKPQG